MSRPCGVRNTYSGERSAVLLRMGKQASKVLGTRMTLGEVARELGVGRRGLEYESLVTLGKVIYRMREAMKDVERN